MMTYMTGVRSVHGVLLVKHHFLTTLVPVFISDSLELAAMDMLEPLAQSIAGTFWWLGTILQSGKRYTQFLIRKLSL